MGSLRKDGLPRISPVEPLFFSGELYLGMMWQSRKALDLQRDPRCTVMNTVHDRMIPDGEFKLFGRAVEVTDPGERAAYASSLYEQLGFSPTDTGDADDEGYHLFKIDIGSASFAKIQNDEWARSFWRAGRTSRRGSHRLDVCASEVVALEEQRLASNFRERVRQAVAEVQPGGMVSLAEPPPRPAGGGDMFDGDGSYLDGGSLQERVELITAQRPSPAFHYDSGFKEVDGRHSANVSCGDGLFVPLGIRLAEQNGADR